MKKSKVLKTDNTHILKGVICCVDTRNSDGSDVTQINCKKLITLGAEVWSSDRMAEDGLTHYIYSKSHLKRAKAARTLDLMVVSPLWIQHCEERGMRVSEEKYLVDLDSEYIPPTAVLAVVRESDISAPLRDPKSPFFNSDAQVMNYKALNKSRPNNVKLKDTAETVSENRVNLSDVAPIPLPTYRPTSKPLDSLPVSGSNDSRRKSERISELSPIGVPNPQPLVKNRPPPNIDNSAVCNSTITEQGRFDMPKTKACSNTRKKRSVEQLNGNNENYATHKEITKTVSAENTSGNYGRKAMRGPGNFGSLATSSRTELTATELIRTVPSSSSSDFRPDGLIALSNVDKAEKDFLLPVLKSMAIRLGGGVMEDGASPATPCSVVIAPKADLGRTLRILYCIAGGGRVVTEEWLYACLEADRWLPLQSYLHPRYSRAYSEEALKGERVWLGPPYSSPQLRETADPPLEFVTALVDLCGAELVSRPEDATLDVAAIAETWASSAPVKALFDFIEKGAWPRTAEPVAESVIDTSNKIGRRGTGKAVSGSHKKRNSLCSEMLAARPSPSAAKRRKSESHIARAEVPALDKQVARTCSRDGGSGSAKRKATSPKRLAHSFRSPSKPDSDSETEWDEEQVAMVAPASRRPLVLRFDMNDVSDSPTF